uniref:Uncharacterized protein n=1 Tax=Arundo donax TaxID=35708 RepID=A0A0A9FWB5_ARUDO
MRERAGYVNGCVCVREIESRLCVCARVGERKRESRLCQRLCVCEWSARERERAGCVCERGRAGYINSYVCVSGERAGCVCERELSTK